MRSERLIGWLVVGALLLPAQVSAQVGLRAGEHCIVQVLNESIPVAPGGSWELPNIPANGGLVRARLHCIRDGTLRSGQSGFFVITPNRMNAIPSIPFSEPEVSPTRLSVGAPATLLTQVGQAAVLSVLGHYADGSEKPMVGPEQGMSYWSTDPSVASVSEVGQVTGLASGAALISVLHDGVAAALLIRVLIGDDTDQDGLPDDYEIKVGLDPQDPLDALGDQDADDLTALQEFELGSSPFDDDSDDDSIEDGEEANPGQDGYVTNPVLVDTDGDIVPDPVEVAVGTDPSDASSVDLAAAVESLDVSPPALALNYSPLLGEASTQLKVLGVTVLGTGIDLTDHPATTYETGDFDIASVGPPAGRVYAVNDGETTITVSAAGEAVVVPVTTTTTEPTALGYLQLPCAPTNVRLASQRAFVACPSVGLLEVDASAPATPIIAATHDLGFPVRDLQLRGSDALVVGGAASEARLARANVSEWGALVVQAEVVVAGSAVATTVSESAGRVAVGVGSSVRLHHAETLAELGGWEGAGALADVALEGDVLAASQGATLSLVSVANPASPALLGSATAPTTMLAIAFGDDRVYGAIANSGIAIFDVSDPAAPVYVTNTNPAWAKVKDVGVDGSLVFAADYYRVNSVPIIRVLEAAPPVLVGVIEFSQWGDDNGTAIDVHNGRAALLADRSGKHTLFLGQYGVITDTAGIPPTCAIAQPVSGQAFIVGQQVEVSVLALDDVKVDTIAISLDDQTVAGYEAHKGSTTITMPLEVGPHVIGAEAVDLGGNTGVCPTLLVSLEEDPGTTVVGQVVDGEGLPVDGALVTLDGVGLEALTEADGTFVIGGAPAANPLRLEVTAEVDFFAMLDYFGPFAPEPAATTDVGILVLKSFVGDHVLSALVARPAGFTTDVFDAAAPSDTLGPLAASAAGFRTDLYDLLAPDEAQDAPLGPLVATAASFVTDLYDLLAPEQGGDEQPLGPVVAQAAGFTTDLYDLLAGESGQDQPLGPLAARPASFVTDVLNLVAGGTTLGPLAAAPAPFVTDVLDIANDGTTLGPVVAASASFVTRPVVRFIEPAALSLAGGGTELVISGYGLADPVLVELLTGDGEPVPDVVFTDLSYDEPSGDVLVTILFGPAAPPGIYILVVTAGAGQSPDFETDTNLLELSP